MLTLERVVGLLVWMAANRNCLGTDVATQAYFRALRAELKRQAPEPPTRQSVSEARSKLDWKALRVLLSQANLEREELPDSLRFRGHLTRAIDGTTFIAPRTQDLLERFSPRWIPKTGKKEQTHYPYGQLVTAINVFTLQPTHAVVSDYRASERDSLKAMLRHFDAGDLSLLDRGLGGMEIYIEHERRGLFFVHRAKTAGKSTQRDIQAFLASRRREQVLEMKTRDADTGEIRRMKVRLVRGPRDSEGKPIVLVTNLRDRRKYSRGSLLKLYRKRWSIETFYGRIKRMLNLERFHSKTYNGVMQEIFAHLLVLSLAALASFAAAARAGIPGESVTPSFTNATHVVRDLLVPMLEGSLKRRRLTAENMIREVGAVLLRRQPGRSYPRVSQQPIQSWNLKKSKKLRDFQRKGR